MIEEIYKLDQGDERLVEKTIQDENIHYIHMIFNKGEGLPEHQSNATLYMTILRGYLSIGLNDQEIHRYEAGIMLKVPFDMKMNVRNEDDPTLELIVIKAPAPNK